MDKVYKANGRKAIVGRIRANQFKVAQFFGERDVFAVRVDVYPRRWMADAVARDYVAGR